MTEQKDEMKYQIALSLIDGVGDVIGAEKEVKYIEKEDITHLFYADKKYHNILFVKVNKK